MSSTHLEYTQLCVANPSMTRPVITLDEAFRLHAPYIARLAGSILGSSDVDDLVQDVFIDAERGLREIRDPAALRSWLATIAVRKARRRLKPRGIQRFLRRDKDGAELARTVPSSDPSPEDAFLLQSLYKELGKLPAADRIAWTLRHVEEFSLPEVAAACECSLATVKRRVRATNQHLREVLGED